MHGESGQGQMIILEGTNDIMNLPFLPDISYYGIHIQEYNWLPSEDDGCVWVWHYHRPVIKNQISNNDTLVEVLSTIASTSCNVSVHI